MSLQFGGAHFKKKAEINNRASQRRKIEILERSKLISTDTIDDDMAFVLQYYDEDGNEMLEGLIEYCQEQKRSLKDLIIDLDFSQLD